MGIKSSSDIFFLVSVIGIMMATISWAVEPMWLAASQWMLISIEMGVLGVYLRLRDIHEGNGKKK
jgi:hypothetical protein